MIEVKRLKKNIIKMVLTVADTERAQWYCPCPWGGWRRQTKTSEWATSFAEETGEGSWRSGHSQGQGRNPVEHEDRHERRSKRGHQKAKKKKESHFISQICFKTVILMLFSSSKQRNHLGFQRNTDNDLTQIQVLKQSDECVWQEIKRHSRAVLQVKCQYGSLCKGI